jgi:hypothetical protein
MIAQWIWIIVSACQRTINRFYPRHAFPAAKLRSAQPDMPFKNRQIRAAAASIAIMAGCSGASNGTVHREDFTNGLPR